jgi:hypothetical protein
VGDRGSSDSSDRRSVEVHDKSSPGALGCPVHGDQSVQVLRRACDDHGAGGVTGKLDEPFLELGFGLVVGLVLAAVGPDVGALHEQNVDCFRRVGEQAVEECGLAPVGTEVSGVEEAAAIGVDGDRVGVERRVVVQPGGDPKRPDRGPLVVAQAAGRNDGCGNGREERRCVEQGRCLSAHVDGNRMGNLGEQSVVVQMGVGDHDPEQCGIGVLESRHGRQRDWLVPAGVERSADVDDDARPVLGGEFDATPADLSGSPVDPCLHLSPLRLV